MSDFFEEPAPPADLEPPSRFRIPPWIHRPQGTLPGVVPLELLLARTDKIAVCVTRVSAYPSGFEVDLVTMSGGEDDELDPMLFDPPRLRGPCAKTGDGIPPDMLRFGVQFADGARATNTSGTALDFDFDTEPKGPVMHTGSGGGGGGSWQQNLWIWPLPPAGPLAFVCEWPAAGLALTRHEIDAQDILDAAGRAQIVFSDEHLPNPPGCVMVAIAPQTSSSQTGSGASR